MGGGGEGRGEWEEGGSVNNSKLRTLKGSCFYGWAGTIMIKGFINNSIICLVHIHGDT